MRHIDRIYSAPQKHWVGDGFQVSPLFNHMMNDKFTSPFLMLDYAMPKHFDAYRYDEHPRGVGQHPHAGFETVTLALQGEVEHHDTTGGGGIIGTGDVQWMTAGNGLVHEEYHSKRFAQTGGMFEMLQLWVNLPAKDKNTQPGYQAISKDEIPVVELPDSAGTMRIIAGNYDGTQGPAHTFTELNLWEISVKAGKNVSLSVPANHNLLLVVLRSDDSKINDQAVQSTELVSFKMEDGAISIQGGTTDSRFMLMSGVPIHEPIAAYGPFVMNTREEIMQKMADYQAGKFDDVRPKVEA